MNDSLETPRISCARQTEHTEDQPLVYIVLRNHNAFPLTSECLRSLRGLTYSNYRILVVDDGSSDDSADRIARDFPEVRVVSTGRYLEYCKSLNLGIREALRQGAGYVFLVNNDTKDFSPNYLEEIVAVFEQNKKVGLAGSLCYDYEGKVRRDGSAKNKLGVAMETPTEGFVVSREAFESVGLLNEKLVRYFEDLDLIIRVRKAGYETCVVGSVSFAHLGGGTSSKQIFIPNYYRVRNLVLFMRKHCADKPLSWKASEFRKNLKVHTDRLNRSLKRGDLKSFVGIGGSIGLGLVWGFVLRWTDENAF